MNDKLEEYHVGKMKSWIDKIESLKEQFIKNLSSSECFCQFPRIVDYVTMRMYYDRDILRNIVIQKLKFIETKQLGNEESDSVVRCPTCGSEYLYLTRLNPRDEPDFGGFRQIKDNCTNKIGAQVVKEAPVSVIYYGPLGNYFGDLDLNQNMYLSPVEKLIEYLFESRSATIEEKEA